MAIPPKYKKDTEFLTYVLGFMTLGPAILLPLVLCINLYLSHALEAEMTYPSSFGTVYVKNPTQFVMIPTIVVIFLHRIALANKYACLSKKEYAAYISPKPMKEMLNQVMVLNLMTGWADSVGVATTRFEINAAAARIGIVTNDLEFIIADPALNYDSYMNFRHWQAFLLGETTLIDVSDKVHKDLALKVKKVTNRKNTHYSVSFRHVLEAFILYVSKKRFGEINTTLVFFSGVFLTSLQLVPSCYYLFQAKMKTSVFALSCIQLFISLVIFYLFYNSVTNFLSVGVLDKKRRLLAGQMLKEMIRMDDLDIDLTLADIGLSNSQTAIIPDFIENENGVISFKSGRNPEVARTPKVDLHYGGRNNVLVWCYLRTVLRNYGERFAWRLDMYASFKVSVMFMSMFILFCYLLYETVVYGGGGVISPNSIVSLFNPLVVGTLFASFICMFIVLDSIRVSSDCNESYDSHLAKLQAHYLRNETDHSYYLDYSDLFVSHLNQEEKVNFSQRMKYMIGMKISLTEAINNCKHTDQTKRLRVFGTVASPSLYPLVFTFASMWVSVFSSIYTRVSDFPEMNSMM